MKKYIVIFIIIVAVAGVTYLTLKPSELKIFGEVSFFGGNAPSVTITNLANTKVCAEDLTTKEVFCTNELGDSDVGGVFKFAIEVPKGTYHVYAVFRGADGNEKQAQYRSDDGELIPVFIDPRSKVREIVLIQDWR